MLIGVPKEIKNHEYRVGLTPAGARELSARGHQVLVQRGAGAGIGVGDEAYEAAGARIVDTAEEVYARAAMIIKVNFLWRHCVRQASSHKWRRHKETRQ